jgi:L-amino acid N-acyltransferase YncA
MVRIRLAREVDAEAVAAIYAPFVGRTAISFETEPPARDEMRRRIASTTANYPWLVCETGDGVLGYAYATQHRSRAAYRWSVDTSVYIDPAHHRRGAGRGLYASLFAILRAQGFVNAYAGITLPNPGSVGLHEGVGFAKVGVYEQVGYKCDRWHDVGWWQLALLPRSASPTEPLPLTAVLNAPGWEDMVRTGELLVRLTGEAKG